MTELARGSAIPDEATVVAAWILALDTMILKASSLKTCSWLVEKTEGPPGRPDAGSALKLRKG